MKRPLCAFALAWITALCVQPDAQAADRVWFTIVGNPANPGLDTIQVDVDSIQGSDAERTASVRVSRSTLRTSQWATVQFRSFEAVVSFDCRSRDARYRSVTYWSQPIWRGEPAQTVEFGPQSVAVMRFRGVEPNPAERIVRAACELHAVSSARPKR